MWRRGQPFDCTKCGSRLTVPKAATGLALAMLVALYFLRGHLSTAGIAVIIVVCLAAEWLLAKVQLAQDSTTPA